MRTSIVESCRCWLLTGFGMLFLAGLLKAQAPEIEPIGVISELDQPFLFSYLSWQDKVTIENGVAVLKGVDNKGGAGFNQSIDASQWKDASPVIKIKVGPENQLKSLRLMLVDKTGKSGTWNFAISADASKSDDWIWLTPADGAALSAPNDTNKEKPGPPNLDAINQIQLSGDWNGTVPVDLKVDQIAVAEPTNLMLAMRKAKDDAQSQAMQEVNRQREEMRAKYSKRSESSPQIESISMVAPDIMAITIVAGQLQKASLEKYIASPDDKLKEEKNKADEVEKVLLQRNGTTVGLLIGKDRNWLTRFEHVIGDPLLEFDADSIETYSVRSTDDKNYLKATSPVAVYRKSRVNHWAQGSGELGQHHTIYLRLPAKLSSGKKYILSFNELKAQTSSSEFLFNVVNSRSDAVHVNQIGYRPDDPIKRAFVSCWLGNGGSMRQSDGIRFVIVDDTTGKKVFEGKSELHFPASRPELMARDTNFNGTDVSRLDFSEFKVPGKYRIAVEGIGCSYPFKIGEDVWTVAFKTQMRGLFHNRSGVELGPPHTTYNKPRDMHPDDGYSVTATTYRAVENGNEAWDEIPGGDTGKAVDGWGGYHDAGDWNPRRVTHMKVTLATLEMFEQFPNHFSEMKLNIPETKGIPDLLAEAILEFSCFRRMQEDNGGVGYGIESKGDPLTGEVSWLNSFPSFVLAPDYASSWFYSAVGARLSRLVKPYDIKLADDYQVSAIRAFEFAEQDFKRDKSAGLIESRNTTWEAIDSRNLAALELYKLTRDEKYHTIFLEDTVLKPEQPELFAYGTHVQRDHAFHYAQLPDELGDKALKAHAIAGIVSQAERALTYASNNAFNVTTCDKYKPQFIGFYSTPDAADLTRAHYLTGDERYLIGAVQSTQFQSGCNPNNFVYMTGLGANPLKNVFKLDARWTGQDVPAGLVPYGNIDFAKWNHQGIIWPITWVIGKDTKPSVYEWPTHEAYWDLGGWPMLEEFTVDSWTPNVLVWGYLSARK